jgi:hypothetical protein
MGPSPTVTKKVVGVFVRFSCGSNRNQIGNSISTSGLVLNPGQRYYLDCFIDDNKKFIFNTYDVDDSNETANATEKNGLLEVFFYKVCC